MYRNSKSGLLAVLLLGCVTAQSPPAPPLPDVAEVDALPFAPKLRERNFAGYVSADGGATRLFVWLAESRGDPTRDPLILWLNGGPGVSSLVGMLLEIGPYRAVRDGQTVRLVDNPHTWNAHASVLVIDQPAGVGLSRVAATVGGAVIDPVAASEQLHEALVAVLDRFPQYRDVDLYLLGESYAGHYLPKLATRILDANASGAPPIRLRGLGLGDAWVAPGVQYRAQIDHAWSLGVLTTQQRKAIHAEFDIEIWKGTGQPTPAVALNLSKIEARIEEASGTKNVFNVRDPDPLDLAFVGCWLDRPDVRAALHADLRSYPPWQWLNDAVGNGFMTAEVESVAGLFPPLFRELRVFVWNGTDDIDCSFLGEDRWLEAIDWPQHDAFVAAAREPWVIGERVVGRVRSAGKLTQVLVLDSGHLVPRDQPEVALEIVERLLSGKGF